MIKITSSFVTNISYKLQHIRTTMWKWWWNVFVCQSTIISHHIISHPANIFFLSCKQMSYLPTPLALGTLFVSFHGNTILVNVHVSTKIIKVIHFFQILMLFIERQVLSCLSKICSIVEKNINKYRGIVSTPGYSPTFRSQDQRK